MTTEFSLPPPVELGFAPKFIDWRLEQLDGINFALDAYMGGTRAVAISAPTGSGKSLMAMTIAQLTPGVRRAVYLTSTKGLEDQVAEDFRGVGAFDVRGQRNYVCRALQPDGEHAKLARYNMHSAPTCDDGPCHFGHACSLAGDRGNPTSARPSCDYYGAVWKAQRSSLVVTNYAYWMSQNAYGQGLGEFDLLIIDEAHHVEQELEKFLTLKFTEEDAWRLRGTFLPDSDSVSEWKTWANGHIEELTGRLETATKPESSYDLQSRRELQETHRKMQTLAGLTPKDWVLERFSGYVTLSPIKVSLYAEAALLRSVPKVLLLSATLTPKTSSLIGFSTADVAFHSIPSSFPRERRPVYLVTAAPAVFVDSKHAEEAWLEMWRIRIDNLIRPRLESGSGLIHTVAYKRGKYLQKTSQFRKEMIFHDSKGTADAVKLFRDSDEPRILVSPSIHPGWDFPYDHARWQIVGKMPFPDTRGPIMEARMKEDPEYSANLTATTLQQIAGRIVRAEDDWGETLIVDMNAQWFVRKYRHLFSESFLDSWQEVSYLPKPLHFTDEG